MSAELDMIAKMTDQSAGAMAQIRNNISGIKKSADAVSFAVLVEGASRAADAIGNAFSKASELTRNALEDQESVVRVQTALENTGAAWTTYASRVEDAIKSGARYGETDDDVRGALSLLLAETGNAEEAFTRLKDAEDLARGANIDLQTAARLLGKVTDENTNALKRYGVEAKGSQIDSLELKAAQLALAEAQEKQNELLKQGPTVIKPNSDAYRDVQRAQEAASLAQTKYNDAVKKYGVNSTQARGALVSLHSAQDRLTDAKEKTVSVTKGEKASDLELARAQQEVEEAQRKVTEAMKGTATATDVLAAVREKFGGQSEKYAQTEAAQAEAARIHYDELKESLGNKLLPVQTAVLESMLKLPPAVQLGGAAIATFGGDSLQAAGGIGQLLFGLRGVGPALQMIGPMAAMARTAFMSMGMALLTPPLGIVVALVAAGVAIYVFRDQIKDGLGAAWGYVKGFASDAWNAISGFGTKVLGFFRSNWPEIATLLSGPLLPFVALATDGFGIRTALVNLAKDVPSAAKELGLGIARGIRNGLQEGLDWLHANVKIKLPEIDLGPAGKYGGGTVGFPPVSLPEFAIGTDYVQRTGPAIVHEGEEIITARQARENRRVNANGSGGITVQFLGPVYGDRNSIARTGGDVAYSVTHAMRFRGAVA